MSQTGQTEQQDDEAPPEAHAAGAAPVLTAVAAAEEPPAVQIACYSIGELTNEFRQGEIITGLEQVVRILPDGSAEVKQHPYCIVFSQDCDLAADHRARQTAGGNPAMNGILLLEAYPLEEFIGTLGFKSNEKKQMKQNNNTRYHVLEAVAAADDLVAQGFAGLAIDFRRYFTLTAEDMVGQLGLTARRRCRLVSPYVEHLQSRALHYLGRVALPDSA